MPTSELPTAVVPASTTTAPPAQARPRHDDLVEAVPAPVAPHASVAVDPSDVDPADVDPADVDSADVGRGTPLQALAGWGAALVVGAACWAGALAVVTRVL